MRNDADDLPVNLERAVRFVDSALSVTLPCNLSMNRMMMLGNLACPVDQGRAVLIVPCARF
jgi:hypothetical protein